MLIWPAQTQGFTTAKLSNHIKIKSSRICSGKIYIYMYIVWNEVFAVCSHVLFYLTIMQK